MTEHDFEELARLSRSEHDAIFQAGDPPVIDELVGFDFCGWNCSLLPRLGGFQKFVKGFGRRGDAPEGWNVATIQNGIDGDWLGLPADDRPRRFGFYTVGPTREPVAGSPSGSLFLDYGAHPANPRLDPSRLLRDVLVKVEGDPDLLLGRAHFDFGAWVFAGYFLFVWRREIAFVTVANAVV